MNGFKSHLTGTPHNLVLFYPVPSLHSYGVCCEPLDLFDGALDLSPLISINLWNMKMMIISSGNNYYIYNICITPSFLWD